MDDERVSFTAKELLVEVRDDVRSLHTKIDLKADRERVHVLAAELAATRLEQAQVVAEVRQNTVAVIDHSTRLDAVEKVWDRVSGGLKVASLSFGTFSALLVALFAYLLTGGQP